MRDYMVRVMMMTLITLLFSMFLFGMFLMVY